MEKDYSLLRPFDLEAAKAGAPILLGGLGGEPEPVTFVGLSRNGKNNVIECEVDSGLYDRVMYAHDQHLRMAPICWVEGKPVYKGDVLYQSKPKGGFFLRTADRMVSGNKHEYLYFAEGGSWATDGTLSKLTWTPPKVKREIKMLATITLDGFLRWVEAGSYAYDNAVSGKLRFVPSEDKTIVIEE